MNTNYTFQLSHDELFWLAQAFKIISLPLPGVALSNHSSQQIKQFVSHGETSLRTRSLIRQSSDRKWQVDHLPAAIVRWMGTSKWKIIVKVFRKDRKISQLHAFVEEAGLSVAESGKDYLCVLYPDVAALQTGIWEWIESALDSPSELKNTFIPDSIIYQLPQPETLIPFAWRNNKLAEGILKRYLPDVKHNKLTAKWLDSLEWAATLTRVNLETKSAKAEKQSILCGAGQGVWTGGGSLPQPDLVSLTPISWRDVRSRMGDFL
jgi:hypothetical protein